MITKRKKTICITKLNWSYIAGFFDGEGCIYFHPSPSHPNGRIQLHLVQMVDNQGKKSMEQIIRFLNKAGIHHAYLQNAKHTPIRERFQERFKVKKRPRFYKGPKKIKLDLRIERQREILKFLRMIEPFLLFKKPKVKKALCQLEKYLI